MDKSEHNLSSGTCSVCGYVATKSATGLDWHYDDDHHWHEVDGKVVDSVNHVYNTEGVCTVCGYYNPEYEPDEDD